MSAYGLNDAARRNARAQELDYRNEYERRKDVSLLRSIGFPLSNQANRRALQGYLEAVNRMAGLEGRAAPDRGNMQAFIGLVQRSGLNRQYSGQPVTALLEERRVVAIEDGDWEEWWTAYV